LLCRDGKTSTFENENCRLSLKKPPFWLILIGSLSDFICQFQEEKPRFFSSKVPFFAFESGAIFTTI